MTLLGRCTTSFIAQKNVIPYIQLRRITDFQTFLNALLRFCVLLGQHTLLKPIVWITLKKNVFSAHFTHLIVREKTRIEEADILRQMDKLPPQYNEKLPTYSLILPKYHTTPTEPPGHSATALLSPPIFTNGPCKERGCLRMCSLALTHQATYKRRCRYLPA